MKTVALAIVVTNSWKVKSIGFWLGKGREEAGRREGSHRREIQGREEAPEGPRRRFWRQEEEEAEEVGGDLQDLHLQGAEAGSSRHWDLEQSYGYHE